MGILFPNSIYFYFKSLDKFPGEEARAQEAGQTLEQHHLRPQQPSGGSQLQGEQQGGQQG